MAFESGWHFGFACDNIANCQNAKCGGSISRGNPQAISYTANNLNQYPTVLTPEYRGIVGVPIVNNAVTVNGRLVDREIVVVRS